MQTRPGGFDHDQLMTPQEALFKRRVLCLYGVIIGFPTRLDNLGPTYINDMMLELDHISHEPIRMIVDSPGGLVGVGLALYDMMKLIKSPVYIYARSALSMAALILAAGEKGHRYVFPSADVMLHLPRGVIEGDAVEIEKGSKQIKIIKNKLIDLLIENGVNKTKAQLLKLIDRDYHLTAEEAVEIGIADKIVTAEDLDFGEYRETLYESYGGVEVKKG